MSFDPSRGYEKHPQVAIRREEFGGLAYHYGNRRLVFLRSPALADLVEALADFPDADRALTASVPAGSRTSYEKALGSLLSSEVIRVR